MPSTRRSRQATRQPRRYTCPVDLTLDVIGGKWKPLILWEMRSAPRRFNAFLSAIPGINHKVLTQQLRALVNDGIITRTQGEGRTRHVVYAFSALGETLRPTLNSLAHWAKAHYRELGVQLDWPAARSHRAT